MPIGDGTGPVDAKPSALGGTRGGVAIQPVKPTVDDIFCSKCGKTTKHSIKGNARICSFCGLKKYPQIWNRERTVEDKIMEALGLICEDESMVFKHEGLKKKKTAEGAHRFDEPVEYAQMQHDDRFWYKKDVKKLG